MKRLLLFVGIFSSGFMLAMESQVGEIWLKNQFPSLKIQKIGHGFSVDLEKKISSSKDEYSKDFEALSKSGVDAQCIHIINLSNNRLLSLRDDSLNNFSDLRVLNLSGNQLSEIPSLKNLIYLDYLDLTDNKLKDLSFLEGVKLSIKTLILNGNPLLKDNRFDVTALVNHLPNLRVLSLSKNHFSDKERERIKQELAQVHKPGNLIHTTFDEGKNLTDEFISESSLEGDDLKAPSFPTEEGEEECDDLKGSFLPRVGDEEEDDFVIIEKNQ